MPQIAANYPNLSQMFGDTSVFPVMYGNQQFDTAQQAAQLNNQQGLQDYLFSQQNNPQRLQRADLDNQSLAAQIPGQQATSDLNQDKAYISRNNLQGQAEEARITSSANISENEIKLVVNHAQQMAMSPDPQEQAIGEQLLGHTKDMIAQRDKQRAEQERMIAQIRESGNQSRLTQDQAIQAGKYKKGGVGISIEDQIASGKLNYEKAATLLSGAAFTAEMEGDADKAQQYRQMADQYNQKYIAGRQAGAQAGQVGKVDTGAVTGMPTQQAQPTPGFNPIQAQNLLSKLPPGTKDNGNGTFTLSDGRIVKPKAQ